jgi:hypothetical protein
LNEIKITMANKAKQTTCGIKKYVTDRQTDRPTDRQTNEFILGLTDPRPQSRENSLISKSE